MPNNDHEDSDNSSPSDNSPSEGDPDSEDKQATESGTESNSSSKQEQSAESKTSSSFSDSSSDKPSKKRDIFTTKDNGSSPTFPVKLHLILSNPEFEKIVAWLPHGRAWRILDHKALEEKVIPLYFRHGRYSSFARQINGWGFKRIVHGADYNAYYHELFLRGMPHLCAKMKRPTSKSTANKEQVDSSDPAPDFYAMSRLQPLPEPGSAEAAAQASELEKGPKPAVIGNSSDSSTGGASQFSTPPPQGGKSEALEQLAQLLNQNAQQPPQQQTPQAPNQLSTLLSLLNGGSAPKPVVQAPQNPLQQILSGLGGNNNVSQPWDNNSNPQAQLAALLQQQLQPPPPSQNPQQLLASLLNQNSGGQNNQAELLSNLLNNQSGAQNKQQSMLNALLGSSQNQNQANPANLLQVLSTQLQQQQPAQSQPPPTVSFKSHDPSTPLPNQQQKQPQEQQGKEKNVKPPDQSSEREDNGDKTDDPSAGQGPAKRQKQSKDADVASARTPSAQDTTGNSQGSSDPPNIAAILSQLSGQQGGSAQGNGVTGALSQLMQSMSQKNSASSPKPIELLKTLQQSGQVPTFQQQPNSNNALSNVLSILQQRGNQGGYMGSNSAPQAPANALLTALQQQQGLGGGPPQGQDGVAGLLQQIMGQQSQPTNPSNQPSGNPVIDALQRLVAPAQPTPPPPPNNPLAQLQQLLGQNQAAAPAPTQFGFPQQVQRNNGSDLLASLGMNQGGNNPSAAMLQQLLSNNNNSSNQKPAPVLNAELLASLGLSNKGQNSGTQTPSQVPQQSSSNQPSTPPRNQQPGMNQGQSLQDQSSKSQQNSESAARSVAAILSAFNNQANKTGN